MKHLLILAPSETACRDWLNQQFHSGALTREECLHARYATKPSDALGWSPTIVALDGFYLSKNASDTFHALLQQGRTILTV